MADNREQRIFTTEQIAVNPQLPMILKDFAKEVILANPQNIVTFSREYFERMMNGGKMPAKKSPKNSPKNGRKSPRRTSDDEEEEE